jgi:hypothetical protein
MNNSTMSGMPSASLLPEDDLTRAGIDTSFDFDLGHFDGSSEFAWDSAASFTAINANGAASSTQTVSPKDLFNDGLGSAPPSTAFTNLTSPDINESPYGLDSAYETSPMFDNADLAANPSWYSLFPDAAAHDASAVKMERNVSNLSASGQTSSSSNSPLVSLDVSNRRKSSGQSPLGAGMQRHSSSSGINRRRRKGPLPAIEVDPCDKVAVKRARNTLAARESRQRKLDHVSQLESRIADLEAQKGLMKDALIAHGYTGPLVLD